MYYQSRLVQFLIVLVSLTFNFNLTKSLGTTVSASVIQSQSSQNFNEESEQLLRSTSSDGSSSEVGFNGEITMIDGADKVTSLKHLQKQKEKSSKKLKLVPGDSDSVTDSDSEYSDDEKSDNGITQTVTKSQPTSLISLVESESESSESQSKTQSGTTSTLQQQLYHTLMTKASSFLDMTQTSLDNYLNHYLYNKSETESDHSHQVPNSANSLLQVQSFKKIMIISFIILLVCCFGIGGLLGWRYYRRRIMRNQVTSTGGASPTTA